MFWWWTMARPMEHRSLSKKPMAHQGAYLFSTGRKRKAWAGPILPGSNGRSTVIPDFLTAIETNDLVIGSRYISGVNVINWPMSRLLLSWFANLFARVVTGIKVRDCTSGFKCFRRSVLQGLDLANIASSGYSFQIEVNYMAWKKGFRIAEVPIVFTDRRRGASKMSGGIIREAFLLVIWKLFFASFIRRKR
jgi:dolichol-phosphate mannosyltransferase